MYHFKFCLKVILSVLLTKLISSAAVGPAVGSIKQQIEACLSIHTGTYGEQSVAYQLGSQATVCSVSTRTWRADCCLDAREAHQLKVGGIVRAMGPDPFENCMPLHHLLLRTLCELSVIDFTLGYVGMYEKVATVTVSIKETVSLGQGERDPDRDPIFPTP